MEGSTFPPEDRWWYRKASTWMEMEVTEPMQNLMTPAGDVTSTSDLEQQRPFLGESPAEGAHKYRTSGPNGMPARLDASLIVEEGRPKTRTKAPETTRATDGVFDEGVTWDRRWRCGCGSGLGVRRCISAEEPAFEELVVVEMLDGSCCAQ